MSTRALVLEADEDLDGEWRGVCRVWRVRVRVRVRRAARPRPPVEADGAVPRQQVVRVWQETGLQMLGQTGAMRVQRGRAQTQQRPAGEGRQQSRGAARMQHAWQVLRR